MKNVLTLITGTSIAQAIPIIVAPILTRLYSPEDFGVLAVFTAIAAIIGSIATWRYELAIVIPKSDQEAINITILSIFCSFITSLLVLVIVVVFHDEIINSLNQPYLSKWLYFIPLVIFFIGIFNALNYLNIRLNFFEIIAKTNVFKSFSASTTQLVLGLFQYGTAGLILGYMASIILGNSRMVIFSYREQKENIKKCEVEKVRNVFQKYNEYPKFNILATLFNTASLYIINFIIPILYSSKYLGFYSLSQRIFILPTQIVGSAFGQAFIKSAADEKNETGCVKTSFTSTFKQLTILAVPGFVLLYFIIEELVIFIFGEAWRSTGEISKILMWLLLIRFIVSPLSSVLNLYNKQKVILFWQITLFVLSIFSFLAAFFLNLDFTDFLKVYVLLLGMGYLVIFVISYKTSRTMSIK